MVIIYLVVKYLFYVFFEDGNSGILKKEKARNISKNIKIEEESAEYTIFTNYLTIYF